MVYYYCFRNGHVESTNATSFVALIRIMYVLFLATTSWAVDNIAVRRLVTVVTAHLVGEQVSSKTVVMVNVNRSYLFIFFLLFMSFVWKFLLWRGLEIRVFTVTGFDELYCECGASVMYPPIPCGTRRPECSKPCSRTHSCEHPTLHNCHSQAVCPPCTVLTQKYCYGKHEVWSYHITS